MAPQCHGTLVQISDLHFGDMDERGQVRYDWSLELLWKWLPAWRGGLSGHDHNALLHLQKFYRAQLSEDENLYLILTGDLTSTGKNEQFQSVVRFVEKRFPPMSGSTGLSTGPWLQAAMEGNRDSHLHQAIPGNHDHWPGRYWCVGPPRSLMCEWAKHLPYIQQVPLKLRNTSVQLRVLAVNTDADVRSWSPDRVLARGCFVNQLRRLTKALTELGPAPNDEIRVLLLHHSLAYKATKPAAPVSRLRRLQQTVFPAHRLGQLEITEVSACELRKLLAQFQISVILTGHTHDPRLHRSRAFCLRDPFTGQPNAISFLEGCCGTSTQSLMSPSHLGSPEDRDRDVNTALLHRLVPDGDRIIWRSEIWYREHDKGFIPADDKWNEEFPVWPRPA